MPSGRRHRRIGRPTGAAFAAIQAFRSPIGDPLVESFAGWCGGDLGSRLPDLLEPACWNHRQTAHSFTTGALLGLSVDKVQSWAESARRRAQHHRQLATNPEALPAQSLWHSSVALLWSALAGLLNGILAGYLSHLVLDACSPASIPIF